MTSPLNQARIAILVVASALVAFIVLHSGSTVLSGVQVGC